jgi:hypothetical protein
MTVACNRPTSQRCTPQHGGSSEGSLALRLQDAWDTSVTVNVLGEDVRYFHTNKSGVQRIWVDRCLPRLPF